MVALKQAGLFKLGERPVNRRQPDLDILVEQQAIDIVGRQMTHFSIFEKLEYFQAGKVALSPMLFRSVDLLMARPCRRIKEACLSGMIYRLTRHEEALASFSRPYSTLYLETSNA